MRPHAAPRAYIMYKLDIYICMWRTYTLRRKRYIGRRYLTGVVACRICRIDPHTLYIALAYTHIYDISRVTVTRSKLILRIKRLQHVYIFLFSCNGSCCNRGLLCFRVDFPVRSYLCFIYTNSTYYTIVTPTMQNLTSSCNHI